MMIPWILAVWLGTGEMVLKRVAALETPTGELGLVQPLTAAGDATTLYVLDIGQKVIHQWSPQGRYLGALGRPGKGPGELDMSDNYGALALDERLLWVFDRRRIHVFDRKSGYLRTQDVGGKGYGRWSEFVRLGGRTLVSDMSWRNKRMRLLLLDDTFEVAVEVAQLPESRFGANAAGGTDYAPYAADFLVAVEGDRLWYANWCEPQVTRCDREGRVLGTFRVPIQSDELGADVHDFQKPFFERMRKEKDTMKLPDRLPFLGALYPLEGDRLAIRKFTFDQTRFTGVVLSAVDGKVLARFDQKLEYAVGGSAVNRQILLMVYDKNEEYRLELDQLVPK